MLVTKWSMQTSKDSTYRDGVDAVRCVVA